MEHENHSVKSLLQKLKKNKNWPELKDFLKKCSKGEEIFQAKYKKIIQILSATWYGDLVCEKEDEICSEIDEDPIVLVRQTDRHTETDRDRQWQT